MQRSLHLCNYLENRPGAICRADRHFPNGESICQVVLCIQVASQPTLERFYHVAFWIRLLSLPPDHLPRRLQPRCPEKEPRGCRTRPRTARTRRQGVDGAGLRWLHQSTWQLCVLFPIRVSPDASWDWKWLRVAGSNVSQVQ